MRRLLAIAVVGILLCGVPTLLLAGSKNLTPRMPEFVIERGYSDAFQVVDCTGSSQIVDNTAESRVKIVLKNVTEKPIESAIKVRILYLLSENSAQLFMNGQAKHFDRKNPRIPFTLQPSQTVELEIKARHSIEFSLDTLKKEKEMEAAGDGSKKKKFGFEDLKKFFDNEKFGRRFMIGPVVSKWGIFPVDFQRVQLMVSVPRDFTGVFPGKGTWKRSEKNNAVVFSFDGLDEYRGALFLPRTDAEQLPPEPTVSGVPVSDSKSLQQ
jgi:hypothetical protein